VFYLILPIIFTVIVGSALGGGGDSRATVLVVDEDRTAMSAELIGGLEASPVLRVSIEPRDEAAQSLDDGKAAALVIIPAGLGDALMAGQPFDLSLKSNPQDSRSLAVEQEINAVASHTSNAVQAALVSVAERERIKPFANATEKQQYFDQSMKMAHDVLKTPPARIEATQSTAATQEVDSSTQSSAGQLVTWTMTTLLSVAGFLVYERVMGTSRRLAVTPTGKATILGGNILGRVALGVVQMMALIGFGALLLQVNWGRSPAALAVLVVTFALAATAFGVMLATFCKTMSQANGLAIMFSMVFAALGGCWWPLEITPPIYQTVVKVLPSTWAMQGFTDVIVRGRGLIDILPIAGILLIFAVVFFAIGIKRLRFD
jgi:ABC-2 type transport system permease protein